MAVNKYHGWTLTEIKAPLKFLPTEFEGDLAEDFVQVKVSHCGLCYTEIAMFENEWGMTKPPIICGHEVVGHVSAVGKKVTTLKVGDRVGCSNLSSVCEQCKLCLTGRDNLCPKQKWTLLRGGFGEYVRAHHTMVFVLPDSLPNEYAAPIMCAGATVFGPFKVNNVKPTDRVAVVGIGGLGHLALQIARAWGTEVTAMSTTADKEAEARKFGAHKFIATANTELLTKTYSRYFDFILVTVPVQLDWGLYLSLLQNGGTLCIVGASGNPEMIIKPSVDLVIRELKLVGGATSSRANYRELIDFCALHNIKPQIEVMPFDRVNEAVELVRKNKPRDRIVLAHAHK